MDKDQLLEMKARAERERDMAKENYLRALGALSVLEFQIDMLEQAEEQTAPQAEPDPAQAD